MDVRDEEKVSDAVEKGAAHFGGIDILINNASAIQLTGTLQTSMKRYDLMNSVNARGTYLCSKICLPFLLKSDNPHILNISPPLNMEERWFKKPCCIHHGEIWHEHVCFGDGWRVSRKGCRQCAVAQNNYCYSCGSESSGGDKIVQRSRKPQIMSDAAHWVLTQSQKIYRTVFHR